MFYVWKRGDGHVGATTYMPYERPGPYGQFERLGTFDDWSDAHHVLLDERGATSLAAHLAGNCASCWRQAGDEGLAILASDASR